MDRGEETFCKLCLKSIMDRKFQITLEVISILSLNVNSDEKDNYMCNDCSLKLSAAFDFKVMCLNTEDNILPYIDSEKSWQVDIRDAYLKVKGDNITVTSDQQVCRLCMNIVNDGFVSLEELDDANMLDKYIPEVNLSITKDPVVCKQCWNSLIIHIDFLRTWIGIKKEIKIEIQDPDDNFYVKSEEIDLKFEEHNENGDGSLHESKEEILNGNVASLASINMHTSYSSGFYGTLENSAVHNLNYLIKHSIRNEDSEVQMYKCDTCSFQTKQKCYLASHQLVHKDPSEVIMHKCDECDFQTKRKSNLIKHQILHRDPSEVQMYKCGECDHQSNNKRNLLRHQLRHRDSSEVQMYKCNECDYQTKRKDSLPQHQLQHNFSQIYKCDQCDYQTKWKHTLTQHQLRHRDPSDVQMYQCDECDYGSNSKRNLVRHRLRHRDPSESEMYKCDECEYQTQLKADLNQHRLKHRDSKMKMFKCNRCFFQTNWRRSFIRHQLRHRDPSEVKKEQM